MSRKTTLLATVFCCALFAACTPEMTQNPDEKGTHSVNSTAQWISGNGIKGGPVLGIGTRVGHKKENCDASCGKNRKHIDCQGSGSECSIFGSIEMKPIFKSTAQETYTGHCLYPEDISDEETFSMPDRSFFIQESNQWVNIPKQLLKRDSQDGCFIIKNITFTHQAVYPNL